MILVHRPCVTLSSIHTWHESLRDTDKRLDYDENVCDETKDGVRGLEVFAAVTYLVIEDYREAANESDKAKVVKSGMDVGALHLLLWGVSGLKDEDALG